MKTKYYWKVVSETLKPNIFTSFVIYKGKYSLTYKIGKITKSAIPETGILVFNTKQQAKYFKGSGLGGGGYGSTILKVIPTGKQVENPVFYDYWDLGDEVKTPSLADFPEGTVAFDSVKVIGG